MRWSMTGVLGPAGQRLYVMVGNVVLQVFINDAVKVMRKSSGTER